MINVILNKLNLFIFIYEIWFDIDIGLISFDID